MSRITTLNSINIPAATNSHNRINLAFPGNYWICTGARAVSSEVSQNHNFVHDANAARNRRMGVRGASRG